MEIYDLVDLLLDKSIQKVAIFDCSSSEVVWTGYADDIPTKYENVKVDSIDCLTPNCVLTINVILD